MMKKILVFLNHERYQVVAAFLCVLLTVWGLSCEAKVRSVRDPTMKVTRGELHIEVDTFLAQAEIRYKKLDLQDDFKELVFNKVLLWSQTGQFSPIGLIPTLIGLLGIGAITDNVRKRKEIKRLNNVK